MIRVTIELVSAIHPNRSKVLDVENFDRVKRGPWDLLFVALRACVGDRNP